MSLLVNTFQEGPTLHLESEQSTCFSTSQPAKVSTLTMCCNMILSITGSCVLGVGAQMKTLGWVITPTMLFLGAGMTSEMVWLVGCTCDKIEENGEGCIESYQDFAERSLGRPGWWASAVSSTLSLVGMIIGGLVLEADNLHIAFPIPLQWPLGGNGDDGSRKWWALLVSITTLVYCLVDVGSLLHGSGIIGIVLTVVCMVLVYSGTFSQLGSLGDFNTSCMDGMDMPYHSLGINPGVSSGHEFERFMSVFSVTSYIIFIFAIVVTLPTLRSTMVSKNSLTKVSTISFFIVGLEFVVIMLISYYVFGNLGPQNVLDGMRTHRKAVPGWWAGTNPWAIGTSTWVAKVLGICMTMHLLCSDAIYVPVTVVAIEALLPKPVAGRRSVWLCLRVSITILRFFFAVIITDFVKITTLTSAAFVTMNNICLPILAFYWAGPREKAGPLRKAMHGVLFAIGCFNMVFGTISAVQGLIQENNQASEVIRPDATPECRSAYWNAYCTKHPSAQECKPSSESVMHF